VISNNALTAVIVSLPVKEGIRMFPGSPESDPPLLEVISYLTCVKFAGTPNASKPALDMGSKGIMRGILSLRITA
jgi:hypothetical protein